MFRRHKSEKADAQAEAHRHPRLARIRGREVLLVELRRRVDVAGIQRRVLGDRARLQRTAARRAGRPMA